MSLNENAPRGQVLVKPDSVTWVPKPPLDYSQMEPRKSFEPSENKNTKVRLKKLYFGSVKELVGHLTDNPQDTFRHLMLGPFGMLDVFEVTHL